MRIQSIYDRIEAPLTATIRFAFLGTGMGTGAVLVPHESLRNPPLQIPARRAASAAGYRSLRIYGGSVKEL